MTNTSKEVKTGLQGFEVVQEAAPVMDVVQVEELPMATPDAALNVSPSVLQNVEQSFISSIQATDRKSSVALYNAMNSGDNALADMVGIELEITDFVAHTVQLRDEVTKQPVDALRVVLIDKEGKAYHAISEGVVSSMQKIIGIVGPAPWREEPLKVVPKNVKTRNKFTVLTLQLQG